MHSGSLLLSLARKTRLARMALSVTLALVGLAFSWVGAEPPTDGIGVIIAVQGQVTMAHPQGESAVPAKIDDDVLFKDIIETQNESRTKALFDDETLLTVGEHSRVEITEHIYDPSQNRRSMVVKLVRGKLRALISKVFDGSGSKFEIHTPTAVAAARGTYFVVWVQGDLSGVVNIGSSGRVDFTSAGQTVNLAPGQFSLAPAGVTPTLPAVFGTSVASTAPGQSGLTASQGAPPPGTVGVTPGQSGATVGERGTIRGQNAQAWITQFLGNNEKLLASVRKAIEGTDLKNIPRPEKASTAVFANGGQGQGGRQSEGRDPKSGQRQDSGRKKGGPGSGKQAVVTKGSTDSSGSIGGRPGRGNGRSVDSGAGSQGIGVGVTSSTPPGQGGGPPGQSLSPPAPISRAFPGTGTRGGGPPGSPGGGPPGAPGGTAPKPSVMQTLIQGLGIGVTGGTPPGQGGTPTGQSNSQGLGIGVTGGTPPGLGGTPPGQSNSRGIGIGVTGGLPPGQGGTPPGQGKIK